MKPARKKEETMAVIREITFGDGTVVRITDWGKVVAPRD